MACGRHLVAEALVPSVRPLGVAAVAGLVARCWLALRQELAGFYA